MSIPTKIINNVLLSSIGVRCECLDHSTYPTKPGQRIRIQKTHLTDHYFGIKSGEILSKVVKATRSNTNPHSHISILQDFKNRNRLRLIKPIERKGISFLNISLMSQKEYTRRVNPRKNTKK